MAVIIQKVVGAPHGGRFYPDFSGVARSYNFYPTPPLRSEDGVAAVALGLGRSVVEGEKCLTFCPRYPQHLLQFSSVKDIVRQLAAPVLGARAGPGRERGTPSASCARPASTWRWPRPTARCAALGSTYSPENNAVYDGLSRPGVRLVTFAPVLKHDVFPLRGDPRGRCSTSAAAA